MLHHDSEGKQQITSFHLTGDIIGMESISNGAAVTYCEAMEPQCCAK